MPVNLRTLSACTSFLDVIPFRYQGISKQPCYQIIASLHLAILLRPSQKKGGDIIAPTPTMRQTFFVPARNSRHRIAALALYRALVRSARQIELPKDVAQAGSIGSVASLVRRRFESNKHYTSLRLVYGSMSAGYKVPLPHHLGE